MAMTEASPVTADDKLVRAHCLGEARGREVGHTVITSSTSDAEVCRIVLGFFRGDDDVLSMASDPLSGEWADSTDTAHGILADLGMTLDDADQLLDIWESAYADGYFDSVLRACRRRMESKRHR